MELKGTVASTQPDGSLQMKTAKGWAVDGPTRPQPCKAVFVASGPFHFSLHLLLVLLATLMWVPVCGPLPELRMQPLVQCAYLFLMSVLPTIPAAWLTFAENPVYSAYNRPYRLWGISVIQDQQADSSLVHESTLDEQSLDALFSEIAETGQSQVFFRDGRPASLKSFTGGDLAVAREALRRQSTRGVQMRYRSPDAEHWDTLTPEEPGTAKLVRLRFAA